MSRRVRVLGVVGAALVAFAVTAGEAAAQGVVAQNAAVVGQYVGVYQYVDPLGNLKLVNSGSLIYRWERNGVVVELRDRNGHWTQADAIMARDALDKLPDLYIQKAINGGMQRIYRDGALPYAPWQDLVSAKDSLAGVALPPSPWNYVALGDNTFKDGAAKAYRVITHELGHCVQWSLSGWATLVTGTNGWTGISWTTGIPTLGLRSWNYFPSEYARTNHMEDFAEGCEWYWITPTELYKASPSKYWFMRNTVFQGLYPPASARQDDRKAIDRVVPVITSLGDRNDDWYSLVQIYGTYFMGPLDGGFNTVRYRGHSATHLPISRTHIYSWVPALDEGSAPITVTTQDGTSAGAAFTLEEPWWKFW